MRAILLLVILFVAACKDEQFSCAMPRATDPEVCGESGIYCDLPANTGEWPDVVDGSDGAQMSPAHLSIFGLRFGMQPREACEVVAALTLMDIEFHEEAAIGRDGMPLTAVSQVNFFDHDVTFEGTDLTVDTSIRLRFSQPQTGHALEDITIRFQFWEDAPLDQVAAIEATLLSRFGPPSNQSTESFRAGESNRYAWIISNGKVLEGTEAALCPQDDMELFRHRIFDENTTLDATCHATVLFAPDRSVGPKGRPTSYYLKFTDHKRTLENWQIDQNALAGR